MKDGLSNAGLVFSMIILGIWASSTLALCQISPIPLPLPQVLHLAPSSLQDGPKLVEVGTPCAWLAGNLQRKDMAAPIP